MEPCKWKHGLNPAVPEWFHFDPHPQRKIRQPMGQPFIFGQPKSEGIFEGPGGSSETGVKLPGPLP